MVFRVRDLVVRQRTQTINAIRGHLAEFGFVAPQGLFDVAKLVATIEDKEIGTPEAARPILSLLVAQLRSLDDRVAVLDREIARRAREDAEAKRLMTIPGTGPITATALAALAPPATTFKRGRDFAAWLGLTPLQRSSGGKQKLGETYRMGERTLRRLLIIGASATVRWAMRKGSTADPWLTRMLERKPPMLVIVALANKTARIVWALMAKGGTYRTPAAAGKSAPRAGRKGVRRSNGEYGATVNETGSGKPDHGYAPRARQIELDPIRELPYGPAACDSRNRGRTHVSTRPRSELFEKILLASTGASTHIHDDDVAGFEDRYELLLDIGAEALAIDRPVEHARRPRPV